jgi:hypothetical protein
MEDQPIITKWLNSIDAISSSAPMGDFVECGVYLGTSAKKLAANCKKTLHLFDSWLGVSDLEKCDNEFYKNNKWIVDIKDTKQYLQEFTNIKYYQGWFPDQFTKIKTASISLLHIDASLYYPTKVSLEYFWDLVVDGGYVICNFHDGYSTGPEKAFYEFFGNDHEIIEYPAGIRLVIK